MSMDCEGPNVALISLHGLNSLIRTSFFYRTLTGPLKTPSSGLSNEVLLHYGLLIMQFSLLIALLLLLLLILLLFLAHSLLKFLTLPLLRNILWVHLISQLID